MVTLAPVDVAVIAVFCAAVIAIGIFTRRSSIRDVEFLLAGRSLTTPVFVMSLVSSWYGGILGVGEFTYRYGLSNWFLQGVPYYVFAVVFAFLLAKRVRTTNLLSIPDKLNASYGKTTALLGSFLTFILMTPAPYVLMVGVLIELVTGWPIAVAVAAGTAASVIYLFTGGFRSDINTNVFEFFMMFIGFGVVLPFAASKFGGPAFIASHVPPLHLTWDGGNSIQFVLVWFFIALWTLVDPSFHQRCYAARTGDVARRGILISVIFWILFDSMTTTAGLYARAILPNVRTPVMAYPLLAEAVLPPVAKGLFYVGMLAAIMSTLNSQAFVAAMTLGRDIVSRLRGTMGENATTGSVRWGILITALLSVVLALAIPSVIRLWYTIGTVIIPGLLLPLVASYFDRVRPGPRTAFASMALGWLVSLLWLIAGWSKEMGSSDYYPLGIEPMYAGLAASAAVWAVGMAAGRATRSPSYSTGPSSP
jgi:SSS family solute:Na+ symporter